MSTMRPLIIGGVGGSGTRLVAEVVQALGIHIGSPHLGSALDNLAWPGSRELVIDGSKSDEEKLSALSERFRLFAAFMRRSAREAGKQAPFWGTKVPGSFYYVPYLSRLWRGLRYVHVLRHGLDMALSYNRNQLHNWGPFLGVEATDGGTPGEQLRYWARANTYALRQCSTWLPRRHLLVRFEDLCARPRESVGSIAAFAGRPRVTDLANQLAETIRAPDTVGRYASSAKPEMFDPVDLETVRTLGYDPSWDAGSS